MALNFPNNPANGDIYTALGRGWKYNSSAGGWESLIRVNTAFDSDDITEGATNLYQNPENVQDEVNNLLVQGTNITLTYDDAGNSLTVASSPLNFTLASGSANSAAADGAGLTVDGASATLTYASTGDKWVFNKPVYENTYKLLNTNDTINSSQLSSAIYVSQTFTGDNTTTAFTLSNDPGNSQALLVLVDNVVQEPAINYTTSSTTLTFTSAPALNARIYVRYLGLPGTTNTVADGSITNAKLNLTYSSNQYTGDNTTVDFTIASGHTVNSLLVILDGLILPPSDYSVNGTTLTFASAPLLNQSIDIRYMPV